MINALSVASDLLPLTAGFKWLGNKTSELLAAGKDVLFSYEEALGYCVGDRVADKDGLSAAVVFVEMVSGASESTGSGDIRLHSHSPSFL